MGPETWSRWTQNRQELFAPLQGTLDASPGAVRPPGEGLTLAVERNRKLTPVPIGLEGELVLDSPDDSHGIPQPSTGASTRLGLAIRSIPWSSAERNGGRERSRFEKPAADIRDVEGRRAVLNRHQPTQFVQVEVRVGFLTERKADEGRR